MTHKQVMNPLLVGLQPHARQHHGQKATFDQMFKTTLHHFGPNRHLVAFRRRGRRVWTHGLDAKGRVPYNDIIIREGLVKEIALKYGRRQGPDGRNLAP